MGGWVDHFLAFFQFPPMTWQQRKFFWGINCNPFSFGLCLLICLHVFEVENNMLTLSLSVFVMSKKIMAFFFFSNPCESPNPGIYLATFCLFVITKEEFGGRP